MKEDHREKAASTARQLEELKVSRSTQEINEWSRVAEKEAIHDFAARNLLQSGLAVAKIALIHEERAKRIIDQRIALRRETINETPELATDDGFNLLLNSLCETVDGVFNSIPAHVKLLGIQAPEGGDYASYENKVHALKAHAKREVQILKHEVALRLAKEEVSSQGLEACMNKLRKATPAAFLSYTHFDDEHNKGTLTEFRNYLSAEVRAQTGDEFLIFQDKDDIKWGQNWRQRIDETLGGTTFLIPVMTPSFFKSSECRGEVEKFLNREKQLNRNDLILPLYFIDTQLVNDKTKRAGDPLAEEIGSHQYADWRELRFEPFSSPLVRKAIEKLAIQIRNALERTEELVGPTSQQRPSSALPMKLQPPKEERGLVEAQGAAQDLLLLFPQIAAELNDSTERVNKKIGQLSGGPQDAKIASLIAADMNSGTTRIERLLTNVGEHINVFIDFFSGYVPELDPSVDNDRTRLIEFRDQFLGLSETLGTGLERLSSNRSSGSKLRISSEVIRASNRRAECLNQLISSMQKLHTFLIDAINSINNMLGEE